MSSIRNEDCPQLEPFKSVLARQLPLISGQPFEMTPFSNSLPRSAGDPWRGAYSKHGFWYKFGYGDKDDFEKMVAFSYHQDRYLLEYDQWDALKQAYNHNYGILVAKNLKDEVMGCIGFIHLPTYTHLGFHYVMEEYRHSGIGSKLLEAVQRTSPTQNFLFNSQSHLLSSSVRFRLRECDDRRFVHITLDKPNGYQDLEDVESVRMVAFETLDDSQVEEVVAFDAGITGSPRGSFLVPWLRQNHSHAVAAFDEQDRCVALGQCRELAGGGRVKRLLIGPLYAQSPHTAQALTKALLKQYYNPENDFDWNPDIHAIYRRTVAFIVPKTSEAMKSIISKLKGDAGTMTTERIEYQTVASVIPNDARLDCVYAVGCLHSMAL